MATTSGQNNTFFGFHAAYQNTIGGENVFIGLSAGGSNTGGNFNTLLGSVADVGSGNLDHATAIGAEAVVSSSDTIALGRADGSDIVDVPGKLQIDTMAATGGQPLCLNNSNRVRSVHFQPALQDRSTFIPRWPRNRPSPASDQLHLEGRRLARPRPGCRRSSTSRTAAHFPQ